MAGFFFCLAPAEGAGLLFCPDTIQHHTSVYSALCSAHAIIPPTLQNGAQGFTRAFPTICQILPPQIPDRHKRIKCSLRHVGAYHSAAKPPTHTRYHRHAGTLYRSTQAAYYNNVYKKADYASPAGSRCFPCPAAYSLAPGQQSGCTGGQSSNRRGGAEPLTAIAAALFGLSPDS